MKIKYEWGHKKVRGILNVKKTPCSGSFAAIIKSSSNFNKPKGKIIANALWMWFILERQHDTQIADPNSKRPWHMSNDCQMKIHGYD